MVSTDNPSGREVLGYLCRCKVVSDLSEDAVYMLTNFFKENVRDSFFIKK